MNASIVTEMLCLPYKQSVVHLWHWEPALTELLGWYLPAAHAGLTAPARRYHDGPQYMRRFMIFCIKT